MRSGNRGSDLFDRAVRIGLSAGSATSAQRWTLINLAAGLASISSAGYALFYAVYDFSNLWPAVLANLICVVAYLCVPFFHRFGEHSGAIAFIFIAYASLFYFVYLFGDESGIQLNYLGAGALAFVFFSPTDLRYIVAFLVIGLGLHVYVTFQFSSPQVDLVRDKIFLLGIYVYSAASIIALVASVSWYAFRVARIAQEQTDQLLLNILPATVADRLKANPSEIIAERFDDASVLFADIVGFTDKCNNMSANELVCLLNRLFCVFDELVLKHNAEKIKTIGDAYMVVSGIPRPCPDHAVALIRLSFDMIKACEDLSNETGTLIGLRVGIASGSITAGVIGKTKFAYDVWAPTVNLAARLESAGRVGEVQVCSTTRSLASEHYHFRSNGMCNLKGFGEIATWLVDHSK